MKCILIFTCFIYFQYNQVVAKLFIVLEKFESCPKFKSATMVYNNTKVIFTDKVILINFDAYLSKAFSTSMSGSLNIEKCMNKENQNSCMPFYNFKIGRMCDLINKSGPGWSSFATCYSPSFNCPLKKGLYRARNCTLDVSAMDMLPLSEGYWKVQLHFIDPRAKSNTGCLEVHGDIRQKY